MTSKEPGFYHYDDLSQFLAVVDGANTKYKTEKRSQSWNTETYATARERCTTGNADLAARAATIIEKIEASGIIKRGTLGYVQDVAGEFPLVPAFVAGDHECMMRKGETEMQTDRSPLKVFVGVGGGQDWTADQLLSRGVYVMALVQLLSERRAVELYWYCPLGTSSDATPTCPVVPIQTQPLDTSTAAHILASTGFFRSLCFAFNSAKGGTYGSIPWAWHRPDLTPRLRDALGAEPSDLVVHSGENFSAFKDTPEQWLIDQLTKYAPDMLA